MKKQEKSKHPKKPYKAPKLKTHGDVAKLTKHNHHHGHKDEPCPGSTLFEFNKD